MNFETEFDIGDAVQVAGNAAVVSGVQIGSDRAVYYTVTRTVVNGDTTTYPTATVPAAQVSAPPPVDNGEAPAE